MDGQPWSSRTKTLHVFFLTSLLLISWHKWFHIFIEHTWFSYSPSRSPGRTGTQSELWLLRTRDGQSWFYPSWSLPKRSLTSSSLFPPARPHLSFSWLPPPQSPTPFLAFSMSLFYLTSHLKPPPRVPICLHMPLLLFPALCFVLDCWPIDITNWVSQSQ